MSATATATAPTTADMILGTWDAPNDPDSALSAGMIMKAVGKSRTTVNDNLRKLAENGDVVRMDIDGTTTWSLTPTRKAALKRAAAKRERDARKTTTSVGSVKVTKASARAATSKKGSTVTDTNETRTSTGRRVKGAIDREIRTWFEANDNVPAGSYFVAKGIDSSAGAAYVALRRMANEGKATLVSTEPDRYAINFDSDAWDEGTAAE